MSFNLRPRTATSKLRDHKGIREWVPSDEDIVRYSISGRVKYLPRRSPQTVKIFLSSTFTDMSVERNALFKFVYPKIQSYCRMKWDLDFQVVDMRWGVRSGSSNDHSASKLCMTELKNCQQESLGPNFVLLLGQRYGTRHLPALISDSEFQLIMSDLNIMGTPQEDLAFLEQWYLCDVNSLPPQRLLQPLDAMKVDSAEFLSTAQPRLQRLLRTGADVCLQKGLIDNAAWRRYFWSVTDEEVFWGLLNASNPNSHCLCFTRILNDVNLKYEKVWRFVDMTESGDVDLEAQTLRTAMHAEVYKSLEKQNIEEFVIPWSDEGGISEVHHAKYLQDFCDAFYKKVTLLIDMAASKEDPMVMISRRPQISEVIEHSHQAVSKFATFQGREDILDKVHEYIKNESVLPFTIHGGSGFGKTSIMAVASVKVLDWLDNDDRLIVVRRFLGTTPDSTNVESLLRSIAIQVSTYCGIRMPFIEDTMLILQSLLILLPSYFTLVIFLDSLDQLSSAGKAHTLKWIPVQLPNNVKLVLSTLPEEHGLLEILRSRAYPDDMFAEVGVLVSAAALGLLKRWLASERRQFSAHQIDLLQKKFDNVAQISPLYVKLMFDIVKSAPSYVSVDALTDVYKPLDNPQQCILYIIEQLRNKHGVRLVNTAFAYLHLSEQGLTENEIVHLLSLDDVVLNDVFQFHLPPLRRLPAVLWARIRHDVSEYIVERDANGAKVLAWYHRQFNEVGQQQFIAKCDRRSELQQIMVDFFMGTWSMGKMKPFTYTDSMVKKLHLESASSEADRFVSDQPNILQNGRPNLRKLSQLPPLLVATKQLEIFLIEVVGCIEPLLSMFSVYSWSEIYTVLESASTTGLDKTAATSYNTMLKCFLLCCATAGLFPTSLGLMLSSRLLPLYGASSLLDHLLEDIYNKGLEHNAFVVPHCQLEGLGTYLLFEMTNDHIGPCYTMREVVFKNHHYIMSLSRKAVTIDMANGNVCMRFSPPSLREGDHFKILTSVANSDPEYFAASLEAIPKVFVFSVTQLDCSGSFDCRKLPNFKDFIIKDLLAFRLNKKECVIVWGHAYHGLLIYDLKNCELMYRYGNGEYIYTVLFDDDSASAIILQPKDCATILAIKEEHDKLQVEIGNSFSLQVPSDVVVAVKHYSKDNFLTLATYDACLFIWTFQEGMKTAKSPQIWHRIVLDSFAHSVTSNANAMVVCTKKFVYLLKRDGNQLFIPHCRLERRLDWAALLKGEMLMGYRLGIVRTFSLDNVKDTVKIIAHENLTITAHAKSVTGIIVNEDDRSMFMSSSADGTIRLFNCRRKLNRDLEKSSKFHRMDVKFDLVHGDLEHAVTTSKESRVVVVWDLKSGKIVHRLDHDGALEIKGVVVQGQQVVTVDASGKMYFWNPSDNSSQPFSTMMVAGYHSMVTSSKTEIVVFTKSSIMVMNVAKACVVTTQYRPSEKPVFSFSYNANEVVCLVDPDRPTVEMIVDETTVSLELQSIRYLQIFGAKVTNVRHVGSILVLAFNSHVVFYNHRKKDVLLSLPMHRPVLAKSSSNVMAARSGHNVHFFQIQNGITTLGSLKLSSIKDTVQLSPDGQHCLVTRMPKLIQLYRLTDMAEIGIYSCYADVECSAFTADGKHVLIGLVDTRLLILLVVDTKCEAHQDRLKGVLQKPSDPQELKKRQKMLIAAADDGSSDEEEPEFINANQSEPESAGGRDVESGSTTTGGSAPVLQSRENINKITIASDAHVDYVTAVVSRYWKRDKHSLAI